MGRRDVHDGRGLGNAETLGIITTTMQTMIAGTARFLCVIRWCSVYPPCLRLGTRSLRIIDGRLQRRRLILRNSIRIFSIRSRLGCLLLSSTTAPATATWTTPVTTRGTQVCFGMTHFSRRTILRRRSILRIKVTRIRTLHRRWETAFGGTAGGNRRRHIGLGRHRRRCRGGPRPRHCHRGIGTAALILGILGIDVVRGLPVILLNYHTDSNRSQTLYRRA